MTTKEIAEWAHQGMDMGEVVALLDAHIAEREAALVERIVDAANAWFIEGIEEDDLSQSDVDCRDKLTDAIREAARRKE